MPLLEVVKTDEHEIRTYQGLTVHGAGFIIDVYYDINSKDGDPAVRLRGQYNSREDEDGVAYFDVENMKDLPWVVHDNISTMYYDF